MRTHSGESWRARVNDVPQDRAWRTGASRRGMGHRDPILNYRLTGVGCSIGVSGAPRRIIHSPKIRVFRRNWGKYPRRTALRSLAAGLGGYTFAMR